MSKKIGCLHAHYSNIAYIQRAIASEEMELSHFVDPGLMSRMMRDDRLDEGDAADKVAEQLDWISQTGVDAILITCTQYIALLDEKRLASQTPIIKIDEPFFQSICSIDTPQIVVFTNPGTVEGTMQRLTAFAAALGRTLADIETRVVNDSFQLIMAGKQAQYDAAVSDYLNNLIITERNKAISVAQLSMAEIAGKIALETKVPIGDPLSALTAHIQSGRLD